MPLCEQSHNSLTDTHDSARLTVDPDAARDSESAIAQIGRATPEACQEGERGSAAAGARFNDNRLYERFKSEARKVYHRAHGPISDDQWDAAFNMSYWKFYQAEMRHPGEITHPASWIATAAKNEIISDYRRVCRQTPLEEPGELEDQVGRENILEGIERRHLLRDISFILNMLPARQRRVWSARFVWDYQPQEIQQNLGLSRKAYEKALQQASSFLLERLEDARGGVCDTPEMESLIRGYAIWGERYYSPQRGALARAHLDDCAACRQTAWLIRHQADIQTDAPGPAPTPAAEGTSDGEPSASRVRAVRGHTRATRKRRCLVAG